MNHTVFNVKTWVKGGLGHGFLGADGKHLELPDIEWDQIEQIKLEGVKSVELDFSGPGIAGVETIEFDHLVSCLIDEGEYEDIHEIRIGYMVCKPQLERR